MISRKRVQIEIPEGTEMALVADAFETAVQRLLDEGMERIKVQWIDIPHKGPAELFVRGFDIVAAKGKMSEQDFEDMKARMERTLQLK
jgi:hypothetical protein